MKNNHELFIYKPSIDLVEGIKVTKQTKVTFENENVKQKISELKLVCEIKEKGENYKSLTQLEITLDEGQIVQFDKERGYFLNRYPICTIDEAIYDFEILKKAK